MEWEPLCEVERYEGVFAERYACREVGFLVRRPEGEDVVGAG